MVTQGPLRRLTLRGDLYVGGYVNYSATGLLQLPKRKRRLQGIVGCIRRLEINNKDYDMSRGAFIGDALHHVNIGTVSIYVYIELFRNFYTFFIVKIFLEKLTEHLRLSQGLFKAWSPTKIRSPRR